MASLNKAAIAPMAAHLAPLLIKNDPYRGVTYDRAKMSLPDGAGIGLERRESF